ncbi:MAG: hypothetical protein MI750_03525 [Xanthomonadales bacterium]|nr:hypothetical protein [Xanthomonadales bacterium]
MNFRSVLIGAVLLWLLTILVPTVAMASDVEQFLAEQGVADAAEVSLQKHSNLHIERLLIAKNKDRKTHNLLAQGEKIAKKKRWKIAKSIINEAGEVISAVLFGNPKDALTQFVGALGNLAVTQGIPLLSGALCSVFLTPASAGLCYQLAFRLIEEFDLANQFEAFIEDYLYFPSPVVIVTTPPHFPRRLRSFKRSYNGNIRININANTINSSANNHSDAVTEIAVARAGRVNVRANIKGDVHTLAENRSLAYTGIGLSQADRSTLDINLRGDVITAARNSSKAVTVVGEASGSNHDVDVTIRDDVVTVASNKSSATTVIGSVSGNDGDADVYIRDGVTTIAKNRSSAHTSIGTARGNDVDVTVDEVNNYADQGGQSSIIIGDARYRNTQATIGGSVTNSARGGHTNTVIGSTQSAYIRGDVVNMGGDLHIGGSCAARRDNQCCIEIHRNYCVISKVPPDDRGQCPPRYELWGFCYLYSDKRHRIQR